MSSAGEAEATTSAGRLGLKPGLVVQELGWDTDVDDDVRVALEDAIDAELVEEALEAVDLVLLWWRDDDGDLMDALVDALTDLGQDGSILLLTPKVGRPGHVDPADVAEAAVTAGVVLTNAAPMSQDWSPSRLVRPKNGRR